MLTLGGVKINFYRFIGLNAMRQILFNNFSISLSVWETVIFAVAMILLCFEELDE